MDVNADQIRWIICRSDGLYADGLYGLYLLYLYRYSVCGVVLSVYLVCV